MASNSVSERLRKFTDEAIKIQKEQEAAAKDYCHALIKAMGKVSFYEWVPDEDEDSSAEIAVLRDDAPCISSNTLGEETAYIAELFMDNEDNVSAKIVSWGEEKSIIVSLEYEHEVSYIYLLDDILNKYEEWLEQGGVE